MAHIIPENLTIDPRTGFAPDIDIFSRITFGLNLFATAKESSGQIIALDAPWGEGKTTFVKMWQGLLQEKGIESIYFDAFSTDFAESPFLALAGELHEFIYARNKRQGNTFRASAQKAGRVLLNVGYKIILDAASSAITGTTSGQVDPKKIFGQINEAQEISIDRFIKQWNEKKSSIKDFRDTLESVVGGEAENPLLIIIDELDRCKPSYALDLIEIAKHLFTVPNVVCLLVLNRDYLNKIISTLYGQASSDQYMNKFIHKWFELPARTKVNHESPNSFIRYNFEKMFPGHQDFKNTYLVQSYLEKFSNQLNLSLREIQRCLELMRRAYHNEVKPLNQEASMSLVLLAITKVLLPDNYIDVVQGYDDFLKVFEDHGYPLITDESYLHADLLARLKEISAHGYQSQDWQWARSVIECT